MKSKKKIKTKFKIRRNRKKRLKKFKKFNKSKFNKYIFIIKIISIFLLFILFELTITTTKNKISIIIPTYNRANLITRSINSVINQTYNNIEILVIDDGSTDNTKNEIDKINDSRVRYIKLRKNKGGSFARNIGIKKARGEYISFQDSDDIFHKDKLEKQINNLIENKSDLDFCKICINLATGYKYCHPGKEKEQKIINNGVFNELSSGNFLSSQSILVKKDSIKKFLFDDELPRLQDYDLFLRMIPKLKVSYTREILAELYRQNDSISYISKKMEKAKELILKKNYDFDFFHQQKFIRYVKSFK